MRIPTDGHTTNLGTFYPGELPKASTDWAYLAGLFDGEGCVTLSAKGIAVLVWRLLK